MVGMDMLCVVCQERACPWCGDLCLCLCVMTLGVVVALPDLVALMKNTLDVTVAFHSRVVYLLVLEGVWRLQGPSQTSPHGWIAQGRNQAQRSQCGTLSRWIFWPVTRRPSISLCPRSALSLHPIADTCHSISSSLLTCSLQKILDENAGGEGHSSVLSSFVFVSIFPRLHLLFWFVVVMVAMD